MGSTRFVYGAPKTLYTKKISKDFFINISVIRAQQSPNFSSLLNIQRLYQTWLTIVVLLKKFNFTKRKRDHI